MPTWATLYKEKEVRGGISDKTSPARPLEVLSYLWHNTSTINSFKKNKIFKEVQISTYSKVFKLTQANTLVKSIDWTHATRFLSEEVCISNSMAYPFRLSLFFTPSSHTKGVFSISNFDTKLTRKKWRKKNDLNLIISFKISMI
jgi:hypothetical protein